MANKRSSAAQAIKDMLELGLNVSFFTGCIGKVHVMNAEISIITKESVKIQKKVKPVRVQAPKVQPTPKHVYNQKIIINVDGTVSVEYTEWDYK